MKKIELKMSTLGVKILEQKTEVTSKKKFDNQVVWVQKDELLSLILDYQLLLKAVKKAGVKVTSPKHFSEEPGFNKPFTDKDVPAFLLKDHKKSDAKHESKSVKKKRVKL